MYRPGGLTALAVFNFVLSGWSLIKLLILLVVLGADAKARGGAKPPPEGLMYLTLGYLLVDIGLMIPAGIGYLKLKRLLGRWLGSTEALVSLIYFAVMVGYTQSEGVQFSFSNLSYLVYPGLTLVLLNVVFRENLVN
jgi:hypothetical protein